MTASANPIEGVAGGVPVPVSDGGGSITIDGSVTATIVGTVGVDLTDEPARQVGIVSVTGTVPVTDNGGSLTVDGTVAVTDGGGSLTVDGSLTIGSTQLPPAAAALVDALANPTTVALEALLGVFNGTTWDRVRGNTTSGVRTSMERTTAVQAGNPAANTALTLTLPAPGAGLFHYITHIYIARVATAALAGGAILEITTTNLNGVRWVTGNQASITVATMHGGTVVDADFVHPLKSAVANTATTIVMPAPGAAVSWRAWVAYYVGP